MELSPLDLNAICKGGKHCPDEQSKAQKYQILYHLAGQQEEHAIPESRSTSQCFRDRELWKEDSIQLFHTPELDMVFPLFKQVTINV